MAISPLALGIGLQGKYDYKQQAALEMSRQKGRAKAEADAETAKAKKRAPYEKAIRDVDTSGLLPYHAKLIKQKYANLLQDFESNPDDYSAHSAALQDINSSSKAFRDQAEGYKRLSIQQGGMAADAQVLKAIGTLSDGEMIQKEMAKYGPATSVVFANDQFSFDNPKYEQLSTTFGKFVKDSMFDPQQKVDVFTIGGRKYAGAEINKEVPKLMTATVMNTDNLKKSAFNDYLQYAIQNDKPYDFSTEQGQKEFYDNTTKFVSDNAQAYIDALSKTYNAEEPRSMNISVNTGAPESGMLGAPVETESVISTLTGKPGEQKSAKSLGLLPRFKDFEMTMPVTTTTIDATTSEVFSKGGDKNVKAKFNGADAYYVAKENIQIPGLKYRKGAIIDENDRAKLMRMGKLDVKFVVFGITDNDDEIYDSYDQAGVIPILGQNKKDAALIEKSLKDASTKFNEYKSNLKQYQTPSTTTQSTGNSSSNKDTKAKKDTNPAAGTKRMRWDATQNKMVSY